MFNISQILRDNNSTFYDFRTENPQSRLVFWIFTVFTSVILAVILKYPSNEFLNAIITTQSILAGFGFNVMFFLLSGSNTIENQDAHRLDNDNRSLEERNLDQKLEKLSQEIFWNISYFNLISVLSVFVALVALIPNFSTDFLTTLCRLLPLLPTGFDAYFFHAQEWIGFVFVSSIKACIYIFSIECIYTFIRTISRINYYFRKKLDKATRIRAGIYKS